MWKAMLNGPIQTALQNRSEPIVISSVCDCLSNIGPDVFSKLPVSIAQCTCCGQVRLGKLQSLETCANMLRCSAGVR